MASVTIEIRGLHELIAVCEDMPRFLGEEIGDAVDTVIGLMVEEIATYPPTLMNQRYQRTGALGRGWTQTPHRFAALRSGNGGTLRIRNPVAYAEDVQGESQGPLFVDRWSTVAQVETHSIPLFETALTNAVAAAEARIKQGKP